MVFKQAWQSVTGGQDEANGAVVATPRAAAIDQAAARPETSPRSQGQVRPPPPRF